MSIKIRVASADDEEALWTALSQAASDEGEPVDARTAPREVRHYLEGWGRQGDEAAVAVDPSGRVVGAAWIRLMTEEDPGYGFVDAHIPELGIGILPEFRGIGIGGRLMDVILEIAREHHTAVSLSTLDTNTVAQHLYESRGFRRVSHTEGAYTMLLKF